MAPISRMLWLDFETTGLDIDKDEIIEIGCILTDFDLNPIFEYSTVVQCSEEAFGRLKKNQLVFDMHTINGLLEDLQWGGDVPEIAQVDEILNSILNDHPETEKIFLAGAGVSHFDYWVIQKRMPLLFKRLQYATVDVSVLRRFFDKITDYKLPMESDPPEIAHRSMADVKRALTEARHYALMKMP